MKVCDGLSQTGFSSIANPKTKLKMSELFQEVAIGISEKYVKCCIAPRENDG